jgi:hypothetical protein
MADFIVGVCLTEGILSGEIKKGGQVIARLFES